MVLIIIVEEYSAFLDLKAYKLCDFLSVFGPNLRRAYVSDLFRETKQRSEPALRPSRDRKAKRLFLL